MTTYQKSLGLRLRGSNIADCAAKNESSNSFNPIDKSMSLSCFYDGSTLCLCRSFSFHLIRL